MKTRLNKSYSSLEEIIEALSDNPHASQVWVGENYSKADLIEDLKKIMENYYMVFKSDLMSYPLKIYGGTPGGGMYSLEQLKDESEEHF